MVSKNKKKVTEEKKEIETNEEKIKKIKIGVMGIGGGGGNVVSEISKKTKAKISFVVADTDLRALEDLPKNIIKFPFGQKYTKGLGTGMNPRLAAEAANREKEEIKKLLLGYDLVIFVATLGGGVGSGATPVFAQISKSLGNLNYGIFTLPFLFEGKRKKEIAQQALLELKKELNALSVLPNERIFQVIEKNTPLVKAFSVLNKFLSDNLQDLVEIIFRPALINIDFSDLKTILEGQGALAYLNSVKIEKKELEKEIAKIIQSPLYPYGIEGAKALLLNITGSKTLSLSEVNEISQFISSKLDREAKIIFGISEKSKDKETKVTVLASGISSSFFEIPKEKLLKKKSTHSKRKPPLSPEKKEKEKPKEEKKPPMKEDLAQKDKEVLRKNGLQLKKEIEKEEAEILMREKFWEIPPFLRKKRAIEN